MNTSGIATISVIGLLSFFSVVPAFGQTSQQKTIVIWNKVLVHPPEYGRYASVPTPEQSAEIRRRKGIIYPSGPPYPVLHDVPAAEQKGLNNVINKRVEAIMRPNFFSPAALDFVTFHRDKSDDPQRPRSLKFHISYKVDGYRVAINGGIAALQVEPVRVFIGQPDEYPVAEDVFKLTPSALTRENIRVAEGETLEEQSKAPIIELKGLAAEFRNLK